MWQRCGWSWVWEALTNLPADTQVIQSRRTGVNLAAIGSGPSWAQPPYKRAPDAGSGHAVGHRAYAVESSRLRFQFSCQAGPGLETSESAFQPMLSAAVGPRGAV